MRSFFMIVLFCSLLSACQSGRNIDYQSAMSIQRNITTEQEIRARFGEPDYVYTDTMLGQRILHYRYRQSDEIKRPIAAFVGTVAGGVLGYQIGDGTGQALATMVGSAAGGAIAGNAVTTRERTNTLVVLINLMTGRVMDFNYTESASKHSPWTPAPAPMAL